MVAVRNKPGEQIDGEVGWTAVTGMLNLQQVLELVKHGFDQGASPEDDFFVQEEQAIGHIPLKMGH